jgi:hypothetical protein
MGASCLSDRDWLGCREVNAGCAEGFVGREGACLRLPFSGRLGGAPDSRQEGSHRFFGVVI